MSVCTYMHRSAATAAATVGRVSLGEGAYKAGIVWSRQIFFATDVKGAEYICGRVTAEGHIARAQQRVKALGQTCSMNTVLSRH